MTSPRASSVTNTDNFGNMNDVRVKTLKEKYQNLIKSSEGFNEALSSAYKNQSPPQEGSGSGITYHIQHDDMVTCEQKFADLKQQLITFANYAAYNFPELCHQSSRFFSPTTTLNKETFSELDHMKYEAKSVYDQANYQMQGNLSGLRFIYDNPTPQSRKCAAHDYEHSSMMRTMFEI